MPTAIHGWLDPSSCKNSFNADSISVEIRQREIPLALILIDCPIEFVQGWPAPPDEP
jgi:hypothetical protein